MKTARFVPSIRDQQNGCPRRFDLLGGFYVLAQEFARRPAGDVFGPDGAMLGTVSGVTVAAMLVAASDRAAHYRRKVAP